MDVAVWSIDKYLSKDFHSLTTVGEIIHPQASLCIDSSRHYNTLNLKTQQSAKAMVVRSVCSSRKQK